MKAYAFDEPDEAGSVRELPVPQPEDGQVRVRVAVAGLNPFDNAVVQGFLKDRMEHRFPLVPGMDASGTVDVVGAGVDAWQVGDDVFGSVGKMYLGEGTLAEFVTLSAGTVARKPESLEHAAAAAVPVAGVTALLMADAIALAEGRSSSWSAPPVASAATSSRSPRGGALGSLPYAAARTSITLADSVPPTRSITPRATWSKRFERLFPDGIDAIADMHGDREGIARLAEQVRSGGHVASAVGAVDTEALAERGIGGTNVMGLVTTPSLETLATMLERGEIVAPRIRSFPLAEAVYAFAAVATGHVRGKIVVTVR